MNDPRILYCAADWLVADKPAGMPMHSAPDGRDLLGAIARIMPGCKWTAVHRLDAATSGCVILASRPAALRRLAAAMAARRIGKTYLAVLDGEVVWDRGEIFTHLAERADGSGRIVVVPPGAGVAALTAYRVLARGCGRTVVVCAPVTGRTHQLRVHFRHLGHPILGDPLYSRQPHDATRLLLHAAQLRIPVDGDGREPIVVDAPLPQEIQDWLPTTDAVRRTDD